MDKSGPGPYLSDLAVDPSIRRMGVGSRLIECCEEECLHEGYREIYLRVERGNRAAEGMYGGRGYVGVEGGGGGKTRLLRRGLGNFIGDGFKGSIVEDAFL